MPFGLTNAPASVQIMMQDIFRDLIDHGVVVYINDILIYSRTKEDHVALVREVLDRLQKWKLVASTDKCDWHQTSVEFLWYIISKEGVGMSEDKVESILRWEVPNNVKDVQAFLGFANFYHRFIERYSRVCKPLTDTTKEVG